MMLLWLQKSDEWVVGRERMKVFLSRVPNKYLGPQYLLAQGNLVKKTEIQKYETTCPVSQIEFMTARFSGFKFSVCLSIWNKDYTKSSIFNLKPWPVSTPLSRVWRKSPSVKQKPAGRITEYWDSVMELPATMGGGPKKQNAGCRHWARQPFWATSPHFICMVL